MQSKSLSVKAKVITGIIYALAVILLATVIYLNLHPGASGRSTQNRVSVKSEKVQGSEELPYQTDGSDKYANIKPIYKVSEVTVQEESNGTLVAYVKGERADNYTGVVKHGSDWVFVRNGVVDDHYNGIAGNELGNWYVKNGKVDFTYFGSYEVNDTTYSIDSGKAVRD